MLDGLPPPPPTPMPGMGRPRAGGAGSRDMAGGGRLGNRPDLGPDSGFPARKSPENCRWKYSSMGGGGSGPPLKGSEELMGEGTCEKAEETLEESGLEWGWG